MVTHYPKAILILDLYHALSYIGQVGQAAYQTKQRQNEWSDIQYKLLLNSKVDTVLAYIRGLRIRADLRNNVCNYLESNRDRIMMLIKSGAC